jgi:26S proteasome regulatory subunit N7
MGKLLLDTLSTFTAELISYNDFVELTDIVNSLTLTRVDLKKRVSSLFMPPHLLSLTAASQLINSPEVIQALPELPILGELVKNLYNCRYDKFFVALGNIAPSFIFQAS